MDLKTLKKTRGSFKSKLTIFKAYLDPLLPCNTLNNLQAHELNTRLSKIQDMYNDYDSTQTEIENLTEIPGEEHTERETFEANYFGAVAAAQELLSKHAAAGAASAALEDRSSEERNHSANTAVGAGVHAIIERLLHSQGRELRRALFTLKQILQSDKDLVHEFVANKGLDCLMQVSSMADHNFLDYILRALGQILLYVDGMHGVMANKQCIKWLYSLISSKFRHVVKTALKLLLVFVEYTIN